MQAQQLETTRLVLRGHVLDDFDDCAALWGDPAVTRHIGGRPSTPEESWSRLLRYRGHWELIGFGYWVLADRASGRFLGEAGLASYRRAIEPPLPDWPEAGWVLRPDAWGRGLATEALTAILGWADRSLAAPGTVAIFDPGHAASLRVAVKAGYGDWRRCRYHGLDTLAGRRLRPAG